MSRIRRRGSPRTGAKHLQARKSLRTESGLFRCLFCFGVTSSQKLDVRYGGTIAAYGAAAAKLNIIPLAIAGWLRYVAGAATTAQGTDDDGKVRRLLRHSVLSVVVFLRSVRC